MDNITLSIIPAISMILVALAAVFIWYRVSGIRFKWFWLGAGLWLAAMILKMASSLHTNEPVVSCLKENLSYPLFIVFGGLFIGIQSSIFEIGLTFFAVLLWRNLGRDADAAIGVGIGAGSFEALLLGTVSLTAVVSVFSGWHGSDTIREGLDAAAVSTPFFWLIAPVERCIAIVCHASSRALVLLGVTYRKYRFVLIGFILFTILDSIAGGLHVSGSFGRISMWWIELAMLPVALISIYMLNWSLSFFGKKITS